MTLAAAGPGTKVPGARMMACAVPSVMAVLSLPSMVASRRLGFRKGPQQQRP
jgi:hypothetical protein